jgi:uncharacterized membrane protein
MDEDLRLILITMNKRIEALERELASFKGVSVTQEAVPAPPPSASTPVAEPAMHTVGPEARPEIPPEVFPLPQKTAAKDNSLESAIGTKWIGRIGMIAMIFGVGFLLKYSFDNNLIGETGRVALGLLTGIFFLGFGEYISRRDNMKLYSQIITGGGLAILYLSVYAGYAFYKLIPQLPAFVALIAVTTTGITLSLRYNAIVIAAIGLIGGFLTPVMLSTGENSPLTLFSYILLLDIGILIISYRRAWMVLYIISLPLTLIMYTVWHQKFYTPDQQLIAFGITTVFFILYNVFSVLKGRKSCKYEKLYDGVVVNTVMFLFALSFFAQNGLVNDWMFRGFILGLSAISVIAAEVLSARGYPGKHIIYSYAGWSVTLSVVALLIIFEQEWQVIALAGETLALCYAGLRLNNSYLRYASYVTGFIVAGLFLRESQLYLAPFEGFLPVVNSRFLICGLIIAAFYSMLYLLNRGRETLAANEKLVLPGLLIMVQIMSVYLLSIESVDYFRYARGALDLVPLDSRYARQLSLSIVWAVYASALIGAGIAKQQSIVRLMGIGLIALTILKVFLIDLSALRTIYRIISFVALGFILLAVSYFYNRFKQRIFGEESSK